MFSEKTIIDVWNKWNIVPWYNPRLVRQDQCWAWIMFTEYGNRESKYGREIDHIIPVSHGWLDYLSNLRPLQWENNLYKSNGRLVCRVGTR